MIKILLVDSWLLNSKVIEQDAAEYFKDYEIEYIFFECDNEKDAIDVIKSNEIDIAYIDISSKEYDGIQLIKDIKSLGGREPKITAVTVLYDKKYRYEALKLNVYRYIYKPYDYLEIEESLEKFFKDNYCSKESNRLNNNINTDDVIDFQESKSFKEEDNDDFMDFDDEDDFIDFNDEDEDEDEIDHSKELMDAYNDSHKKVTAKEFLELYKDEGIDTEELSELEDDLDTLISNILFNENLEENLPDIINILEKYNRFLYMFSEFEELSKVIYALVELLNSIDYSTLKRTKITSKFIVAIIEDLFDWKEHVFILKDAVDVYYINASILNSYVQLKDIITK
ncbi:MAG: response regulator [Campylobacterota bacterium]|nr:response regulator [Campylobacterota bacterium]